MPIPDPEPIAAELAAIIAVLAQEAYTRTLAHLAAGVSPQKAVRDTLASFNGQYAGKLAAAYSQVMQQQVKPGDVLAMPVGDVTLSQRLYAHTAQTAQEVTAIVRTHAQGIQQARELSRSLYDGYTPTDGIQRPLEGVARAKLPKALRQITADPATRQSLAKLMEQGQAQAARLKSEALKAAYMEAFEKWSKGKGRQALEKALWVAEREKTRFMADRIAQTELKRAHTERVAAEIMADGELTVVELRMNPRHPLPDICDVHARANLWGLGPGLYPKAKAPKPPFHPFCWCKLVTRPDLTDANAKERPEAVRELLRTLPPGEAARLLGSRERMAQVLNGGDWQKLPGLRLERVGKNEAMRLPNVPKNMLDGLTEAASAKNTGGFASMWVDPTSHDRHVQRRIRKGEVADAFEYEQKTIAAILDARALKVVTPVNMDMRHTGKMAMMNDSWVVLLAETGRIVTSYPKVDGYKEFEARHQELGDQVDEYKIPAEIRTRLEELLR